MTAGTSVAGEIATIAGIGGATAATIVGDAMTGATIAGTGVIATATAATTATAGVAAPRNNRDYGARPRVV